MATKLLVKSAKKAPALPASDDWLTVSTEGFAEQNAARDPGHLVKELVQNAFDAIDGRPGNVLLVISPAGRKTQITCIDNGCGIEDLNTIRTVFWTSKQDSVLNRGRMGRGFKELLCLSTNCFVESGKKCIHFVIDNGNKRKTALADLHTPVEGTKVLMEMPWDPKETIPALEAYFKTFLPPANIVFVVNKEQVVTRTPAHVIDCTLTTEKWEEGRWLKVQSKTQIELIATKKGVRPMIYEMGIPVTDAEWDAEYDINVLQRVPMNPNRDAVATGYAQKLHKAALPTIKDELAAEELREEWVGEIVAQLPEEVQRDIISKGFGDKVVRSVPTMGGRRDFDADAEELGRSIVNTKHLTAGFREAFTKHVPTSANVVAEREQEDVRRAAGGAFDPEEAFKRVDDKAKRRRAFIEKMGGRDRVEKVMAFAHWFCNELLFPDGDMCAGVNIAVLGTGENVRFGEPAVATWSSNSILTLGIDTAELWDNPMGEDALSTLVHEAAHNRAMHHGKDFKTEIERLSGRAANVMLYKADHVRKTWGKLL